MQNIIVHDLDVIFIPYAGSSSDPWMRGHERVGRAEGERGGRFALSEVKQIKKQRSQLKTPQSVVAGFASSHHHHHHHSRGFDGGREGGVGRVRQIRGDREIDGERHSSSSFGGDGDPMRLAPVKPKGKSRLAYTLAFLELIN